MVKLPLTPLGEFDCHLLAFILRGQKPVKQGWLTDQNENVAHCAKWNCFGLRFVSKS